MTKEEAEEARQNGQVTIGGKTIYYTGEPNDSINYDHIMDTASAPTIVQYSPTEGANQVTGMEKYTSVLNGSVNPLLTSFDSKLNTVAGIAVNGKNLKKRERGSSYSPISEYYLLYSVEFATNAKEFVFSAIGSLRISVDENDGQGYKHTNEMGYIDSEADNNNSSTSMYDPVQFKYYKLTFAEAKERNIKIELTGAIVNIYADRQYEVKQINKSKPKTILFIGDSWTSGTSDIGEIPYLTYPTIIADNLGMTAINSGVAGTGYTKESWDKTMSTYKERLEIIFEDIGLDPDVIVICGGGNDVSDAKQNPNQKTIAQSSQEADECYEYVRRMKPNTPVIVFGVEYVNNSRYNESISLLSQLDSSLKESAKKYKMSFVDFINGDAYDENGNMVIDGTEPFVNDASHALPSDNVHLTINGYKAMANKLTPVVAKLLK